MLLTKFAHACVKLTKDSNTLVIDPGVFSDAAQVLTDANAILITHEHPDHFDKDAIAQALNTKHDAVTYAPASVAEALRLAAPDAHDRIFAVTPGETFSAAGFAVTGYGGQHALIHASIPVIANVGYVIDNVVYHPGDSLIVPAGVQSETLLVPVHAPWSKVAEVIDFVVSVRAKNAFQIHDGLLNETGLNFTESHIQRIGAEHGTTFRHLSVGESVEL